MAILNWHYRKRNAVRRFVILSTKWPVGQWRREKLSIRGRFLHGTVQVSQERSEDTV